MVKLLLLQALNTMVSISNDVSCPVSQWAEDTAKTYDEYIYKADLYIQCITDEMVPFVNFSATEQASGIILELNQIQIL